jgi:hypothetical protein
MINPILSIIKYVCSYFVSHHTSCLFLVSYDAKKLRRSQVALGSSQLGAGQFEPLRRTAPEGWEWLDMLWDTLW